MDTKEYESISIKKAGTIVRKMRLAKNDVITIKAGTVMAQTDNLDALAEAVGKYGLEGIIVVVVDEFTDVSNIKEEKMREFGWYKFDTAAAAIMERITRENENEDERRVENGEDDGV